MRSATESVRRRQEPEGSPPGDHERVVVLGLGNTLQGDDGIGILAARALRDRLEDHLVEVDELCAGGFAILHALEGFDWAVLIDAIHTGRGAPGTITQWAVPQRCPSKRLVSQHDMGLFTALEFGRLLGLEMPRRLSLFTVEAEDVLTVTEEMTPRVEAALGPLVDLVIETLDRGGALGASRGTASLAGAHI
jgi:hydrogenase maturation protease